MLPSLPLPLQNLAGAGVASVFRFALTPIDTLKSTAQVAGAEGVKAILDEPSLGRLYRGGLGNSAASIIGYYPFFLTYNYLTTLIPEEARTIEGEGLFAFLAYRAAVGVASSATSDCFSNLVRVLKTYRQTDVEDVGWVEVFDRLKAEEGGNLTKVWTRGLGTRIGVNALQSGLFSLVWKYLQAVK